MKHIAGARALVYAAMAAVCTALTASWQSGLGKDNGARALFAAIGGCFMIACVWIGVAFYLRHTRHACFRGDVLFGGIAGAILMLLTLVGFFRYGGVDDLTQQIGVAAANYMVIVISVLPLPLIVRAAVAAASRAHTTKAWRIAAWCAVGVAVAVYVATAIAGKQFAFLAVTEGTSL